MDFPIAELLDHEESTRWLLAHFHPEGLACPRCGFDEAYLFRKTKRSDLDVYRCKDCGQTYSLYTGTVFQGRHLPPAQVVLLMRGFLQGVSSAQLARELELSRTTVHEIRKQIQQNAVLEQPETVLPDTQTETDEMFQNAGEKRHTP